MKDPDAVKPDDWDEDAPREIEDDEAEKPEGWLDDEPAEVEDPGAVFFAARIRNDRNRIVQAPSLL